MKTITKSLVKLPKRSEFSKKGDNGRVLIVGGSQQYTGALALAGMAALRSGVDSVVVAAPEKVAWAINCLSPDLVTHKLKGGSLQLDHFPAIRKLLITADCLLIGGGVKERPQSMKLTKKIIKEFKGFKVLDAAALFAFDPKSLQNAILTPNPKEFQRLKKCCDFREILNKGNLIIAKSPRDIIFYKNRLYQNRTGNAGLTKAGTGDVLAGLIAGFLAQSKNMLQSAINGVYFLGLLGEVLYKKKKGYFYLASDLAQEVKRIKNYDSKG